MIAKHLDYKRVNGYEDPLYSSTCVKIKDGNNHWIHIMSIHCQWKLARDFNAFDEKGIKKQVSRLKTQCENIERMCKENPTCIIGRDINIDRNVKNDPEFIHELKPLIPIWEKCLINSNLIQMNFNNTWHMPRKWPSLLDSSYCNKPEKVSNVANVTNLLSEHDAVTLNFHMKEIGSKPQFEVKRNYSNLTYGNLLNELDENRNPRMQDMFSHTDPTESYIEEMNLAAKKSIKVSRHQKKKYQQKFWNRNLEDVKQNIHYWNKFSETL